MAVDRPLLTLMVNVRSGSYVAISCRPGYFKAKRQASLLLAGRIRPEDGGHTLKKQTFNV